MAPVIGKYRIGDKVRFGEVGKPMQSGEIVLVGLNGYVVASEGKVHILNDEELNYDESSQNYEQRAQMSPYPLREDNIKYSQIPKTFNCGGQQWRVNLVDRLGGNQHGECRGGECVIEIARKFDRDTEQAHDCCIQTYYHELVHAILQNIGWDELNDDHKFVCSFAALLTEAMRDARFIVNNENE